MRPRTCSTALLLALAAALAPAAARAASPAAGAVSSATQASWQGGPFLLPNPAACTATGLNLPGCDRFDLTVTPPATGHYLVDVAIETASASDDYDLSVYDAQGNLVDSSATQGGHEAVAMSDLPAGTYRVVVQAFLVLPNSTYRGAAGLRTVPEDEVAQAYYGARVPPGATGTPASTPTHYSGSPITLETSYVGRGASEPTIGVLKNGTAFFAAGDFDALPEESPTQVARTEVLRSKDGGRTWQSVQPQLILGDTTEPPATLDPYVYVEETSGRVFSIDLYGACSWLLYSDDEGQTWTRNIAACGSLVNDHQTVFAAVPPKGVTTQGFPKVLYYCFNQVADSFCSRSLDGGATFLPAGPAYLGVDPTAGSGAGAVCGSLTGHLVADSAGRIFLPKGHCGYPWVAVSEDAGTTWRRAQVSKSISAADTQVAAAVDAADNVYVTWFDSKDRLPYLSVSTDHGKTWGTPLMIAPPGVHEVNFPTIIAGDAGRVALTFPGTTARNRAPNRAWNSYLVVSNSAADANPRFIWTTANDPADPIHRGDCGPGRCAGMFDFLDIIVSPVNGAVWATATDTCTGACVTGAAADSNQGVAIRQTGGPWLWNLKLRKRN